jgi:hypothetical protein
MRSSHIVAFCLTGVLVALAACTTGGDAGGESSSGTSADGGSGGPTVNARDGGSSSSSSGSTNNTGNGDAAAPIVVAAGNDSCADATALPINAANPRMDLKANTKGAKHDVDVACDPDKGGDVFYKFSISKRVIVYADTFGASFKTALFILNDQCAPLTTTPVAGEVRCSATACGSEQSQMVAVLDPGTYRIGMAGRGGATGEATIHFEWALAGSGKIATLPQGSSVQTGTTTSNGGNIDGMSPDCLAAAAEDSYFWARCPADQGGMLNASTCGGTTWESIAEVQIPGLVPYSCNIDGCGLQSNLNVKVPKGAGLGVLSIDGQSGTDFGAYTLTVNRP